MLQIEIEPIEMWDEINERFINVKKTTLHLEHSLLSLYDWESKWHVPFLSNKNITTEQTIDYIRCMTLDKNVPNEVYYALGENNIKRINEYIENPMTATTITDRNGNRPNREIVTAELIYYWMIKFNIPFDREKWHLNRLIMLIRVCALKENPQKKMSTRDAINSMAAMNAARKAKYHTEG